ncbi:MAG: tetratricopeptide repeat protein [Candidatus Karelsulcia muelleri]
MFNTYLTILKKKIFSCLENVWLQKTKNKKIENKHINNYRLIINASNFFHKRKYKEALNIFEKLLSEERISFLKNKTMFKTALCNFYLKKYDEAIFYFNLIIKNSNITEMNFMEDAKKIKILSNIDKTNMIYSSKAEEKKNLLSLKNNEKNKKKNKKLKIFSGKEKQSLFSKSEETLPNKELKKETSKEIKATSKKKQPLEVTLFNLGMCYYKQANDYNFDQQNNLKSIKVFLKFIKSYPNSLKLNTAKKMLYKAVLNLKTKQISIGNFYFKRKKYKASLFIFKDNIENFKKLKKIFSIQNEYIYMIISQYKLEKSTNQFDFKKTLKLYNDYIQNFSNFENQFFYEKKLNLDYRIKNLFSKIERQLFFLKIYNKYIDEYQRI